MGKLKTRRGNIRAILFITFTVLVLAIATIVSTVKANNLSKQLKITSERTLTELNSYIDSITTNLSKGTYANTPTMLGSISTELIRDANGAKNSLSSLPLSNEHLDNTYKFLSQVGSFLNAINKKIANGQTISNQEREELNTLVQISQNLSKQLTMMLENVQNGTISVQASENTLEKNDEQMQSLGQSMTDTEQAITDYPTLIYDGPFSDHILNQSPKMLENLEDVSQDTALNKVADFMGIDASTISFIGESQGTIPAFLFSSESASIAVSKKGGIVLYVLGSSYAGEEKISKDDAISRSTEFLKSKGFENMKDSYYSTNDGICTINFAYVDGDTICYPDLIKVSISLETGNVLSFDSRGYVMNHYDRDIKQPTITLEQAKKSVSPVLQIISSRKAVIPTDYKGEQSTYEFHCKSADGTEVLIYIDNETGFEDDILLLLYSDGGILTK